MHEITKFLAKLTDMMYDEELTVHYDRGFLDVLTHNASGFSQTAVTYHFYEDDNKVRFTSKFMLCGEQCTMSFIFQPILKSKTMTFESWDSRPSIVYGLQDSGLLSVHIEGENFLSNFEMSTPFKFTLGMYNYSTEEEQDQFNLTLQGYGELIELYRNISQQKYREVVKYEKYSSNFHNF